MGLPSIRKALLLVGPRRRSCRARLCRRFPSARLPALLGVAQQVRWINKGWFDADLGLSLDSPVDMIVSNPPYIPRQDIQSLDEEVKNYDPLLALDGGEDGLNHYRQIAKVSSPLLKEGGYILLEVGIYQAQEVAEIFCQAGFNLVKIVSDLGQIARCVILKK